MSERAARRAPDPLPGILRRLRGVARKPTADVRRLRREISREVRGAPGRDVVDLAVRLLAVPGHGHRFVAYELVLHHPEAPSTLTPRDLARLGTGLDAWEKTDMYGVYLSGPAWRDGVLTDAHVERWTRSKDRWWRRVALVSTVPLNLRSRGGTGDAARTLAVCRRLAADRDDMVVKAMSWALRELARRDPASVKRFLADPTVDLAARVRREVTNKLTTGLKNPRVR
jgi:hypothetical protein